jgi:hypothetical protein
MEEITQEDEVSLNPQEDETPLESPDEPEPRKVEVKSKAEEVAQNYKVRAEKAEKELKRLEKLAKQPVSENDSEWKNKVEFLIKNRDVNEEEFEHIATAAARKGISLDDAAKAEKDYIDFRREKVNSNKKTPSPSSAGFPSFEKQITKDTPQAEIDKILEERAKKLQAGTGY